MAIAEGFSALNSLKSLYEIAKDVRDSRDPDKLRLAAAQMFDLALAAREQTAEMHDRYLAVRDELAALKAKTMESQDFEAKLEGFVRREMGGGGFAYFEKEPSGQERKPPAFCAHCVGNKKFSILQPKLGSRASRCPACGTDTW